eukprot:717993-Hanusia_phi.AAC.2
MAGERAVAAWLSAAALCALLTVMMKDDIKVMLKQLEKYRIERDVALAAIGHHSLTEVPAHDPKAEREKLRSLRQRAIEKLHRISRGRRDYSLGIKEGDLKTAANPDCDEGDAKLGLCGVEVPSPADEEMQSAEAKADKELTAREKADDAERAEIMREINSKRLAKAQQLMKKLSETDERINELVHHTLKVAAMAPHTPSGDEG